MAGLGTVLGLKNATSEVGKILQLTLMYIGQVDDQLLQPSCVSMGGILCFCWALWCDWGSANIHEPIILAEHNMKVLFGLKYSSMCVYI